MLYTITGLGRECALLFSKEGGKIIATDIALDKLQDLKDVPGVIKIMKIDVTNKDDIVKMAKDAGRVDILINCAG